MINPLIKNHRCHEIICFMTDLPLHSFSQSFNLFLTSTYYLLGIMLHARDKGVSKPEEIFVHYLLFPSPTTKEMPQMEAVPLAE